MSKRLAHTVATVALAASIAVVGLGPALAASASSSHVVSPTTADRSVLKSTFIRYKLATKAMTKSDRVSWSRVRTSDPLAPLMAYDGVDHRYWALANFSLKIPASYRAEVSFQDGGSYGVYYRTVSGHWIMKGYAGLPICPSVVPSPVAQLWHLVKYQGC